MLRLLGKRSLQQKESLERVLRKTLLVPYPAFPSSFGLGVRQ
jgi:hypothetical protein